MINHEQYTLLEPGVNVHYYGKQEKSSLEIFLSKNHINLIGNQIEKDSFNFVDLLESWNYNRNKVSVFYIYNDNFGYKEIIIAEKGLEEYAKKQHSKGLPPKDPDSFKKAFNLKFFVDKRDEILNIKGKGA